MINLKSKRRFIQKKQALALQTFQQQQLMNDQNSLKQQLAEQLLQWRSIHKQRLANTDYAGIEAQKKQLLDCH